METANSGKGNDSLAGHLSPPQSWKKLIREIGKGLLGTERFLTKTERFLVKMEKSGIFPPYSSSSTI